MCQEPLATMPKASALHYEAQKGVLSVKRVSSIEVEGFRDELIRENLAPNL